MKLSNSQKYLLNDCANVPQNVVSYFTPAKALVRKGMCEWKSNGYREQLVITEAGREELKACFRKNPKRSNYQARLRQARLETKRKLDEVVEVQAVALQFGMECIAGNGPKVSQS